MNSWVEAVKEKQRQKGLTDDALASLLGIDRSTWSKIKSGKRKPSLMFLFAVNDKLMPVNMFAIDKQKPHQKPPDGKRSVYRTWLANTIAGARKLWQRPAAPVRECQVCGATKDIVEREFYDQSLGRDSTRYECRNVVECLNRKEAKTK